MQTNFLNFFTQQFHQATLTLPSNIYLYKVNNENSRTMHEVKVDNKDTRTLLTTFWCSIVNFKQIWHIGFSNYSIIGFEKVNNDWEYVGRFDYL